MYLTFLESDKEVALNVDAINSVEVLCNTIEKDGNCFSQTNICFHTNDGYCYNVVYTDVFMYVNEDVICNFHRYFFNYLNDNAKKNNKFQYIELSEIWKVFRKAMKKFAEECEKENEE